MTKYKFVTIVATPEVRNAFTKLREQLKTTDKQLMTALHTIAMENFNGIRAEVARLKEVEVASRNEIKRAKLELKLEQLKAKKEPAKKAARKPRPSRSKAAIAARASAKAEQLKADLATIEEFRNEHSEQGE